MSNGRGEESETAAQLFARLSVRPTLTTIGGSLFTHINKRNHCIEIIGEEGSGKTEVCLHLLVNTIAPQTWKGVDIGGLDSAALYIDTDYKFPMIRFISLIEQRLLTSISASSDTELESEEFVKYCLQRFYKVACQSAFQLLETLRSLDGFFCENPETVLMIIDNISTYHWTEKLHSCRDHLKSLACILQTVMEGNLLNVVLVRNMLSDNMEHGSNRSLQGVVSARYRCMKSVKLKRNEFSLTRTTSNDSVRFYLNESGIRFL